MGAPQRAVHAPPAAAVGADVALRLLDGCGAVEGCGCAALLLLLLLLLDCCEAVEGWIVVIKGGAAALLQRAVESGAAQALQLLRVCWIVVIRWGAAAPLQRGRYEEP